MASVTSHAWVEQVVSELSTQGRPLEGGWPGTLSEARRLVGARIAADAGRGERLALAPLELDRLVQVVYVRAREEWLAIARRSGPEERS